MAPIYTPFDWYWHAEDGRLFGSKAGKVIAEGDASFVAWSDAGGVPTVWPRDATGAQTQAALDAVLAAAGPTSQPSITYKADLWRRCTDEEADAIDGALKAAPVRQRRLFEDAQYLDHADESFVFARAALSELFGEARAAALLAIS
ncbi:hypothetical protein ABEV34_11850 [Methylorubrum rhodesianum]|uniref:hypothetical protein n=1 Tax=Methylorubrum TaxID=2282523 RepID=UPI00160C2983|nr:MULTISPECIES: hypothetical protein [Methylorubrum]MBB5765716.1 hypothetical protein [Methylorubrum rhodesianum]MBI1691516.1 hypothetical protein [Methylorubrum sp. DB1722]